MKIYLVIIIATIMSCSRQEDATLGGGSKKLDVSVQMKNSDWTTRSGGGSITIDEKLEVVSEYESMGSTNVPTTRGVPVSSASGLNSMQILLYTNSLLTNTLKSTNNGYSWDIVDNPTLDLDKNKYSYCAYSPIPDAKNGMVVQSGGETLIYTAPDDVKEQPDICFATPISDNKTGNADFTMKHALTAVGVKVCGDNVEIEYIKLTGIQTVGTLNIKNGNWTSISTPKDLTFNLQTNNPGTGGLVSNITAANGYFMVPPQNLTDDSKKLIIKYKYSGETEWRTGTYKLSDISGSSWVAEQKVFYVIQLKSKFSLNLERYEGAVGINAGSYTLTYDTNSSNTTLDPQVSYDASWITNMKVNRNGGRGTITFDYTVNDTNMSRKVEITVTSGFNFKKLVFTQLTAMSINLSPALASGTMPREGGTYTIQVSTPAGVPWKVETNVSNCTVSPSSGTTATAVTISVPEATAERDVNIVFATNFPSAVQAKATWTAKQTRVPSYCHLTPLKGYPNTYVNRGDIGATKWSVANISCKNWGGRLPNIDELAVLMKTREYETLYTMWSSTPVPGKAGWYYTGYSGIYGGDAFERREASLGSWASRCVKDL